VSSASIVIDASAPSAHCTRSSHTSEPPPRCRDT
jgi:hypothetical protein